MRKISCLIAGILVWFSFSTEAKNTLIDSVGVENRGGKLFVIHIVEEKETLYGLAQRYQSGIDGIVKNNPTISGGLKIGQRIVIPYSQNTENGMIIHLVQGGETLSSVSRKYGVSYKEVKQWNNLVGESLNIGQKLKIKIKETAEKEQEAYVQNNVDTTSVESVGGRKVHIVQMKQTLFSIGRSYGVSVEELMRFNSLESTDIKPGQELVVGKAGMKTSSLSGNENAQQVDTVNSPVIKGKDGGLEKMNGDQSEILIVEKPRGFKEIEESGLAESIDGTEDTRKYLALHRTAKVGTILRVRNEMNNQEVFVRVLGKLPDTGVNNGLLIKISKAAYSRLGAIDKRFRVHVSYIP